MGNAREGTNARDKTRISRAYSSATRLGSITPTAAIQVLLYSDENINCLYFMQDELNSVTAVDCTWNYYNRSAAMGWVFGEKRFFGLLLEPLFCSVQIEQ